MASPAGGYSILLMNTGKDGKEPSPAAKRQEAFKKIVEDQKPSIIFLQETSTNFLKILKGLPKSYHGIVKGEATQAPGYLVKDEDFEDEDRTADMNRVIGRLAKGKGSPGSKVSPDFDFPIGRLRIVKLTSLGAPMLQVLAVTWHGPHSKYTNEKKKNFLKDFFIVVKEARLDKAFLGDDGKALPLIIGGDFNLERSFWHHEPDFNYYDYAPSERREGKVIDMFVSTKDLHVKGTKFIDMDFKLHGGEKAGDLLKHDPIGAVLTIATETVADVARAMKRVRVDKK